MTTKDQHPAEAPVAYFTHGGRVFVDSAHVSKAHAERSATNNPGAVVSPLYLRPDPEVAALREWKSDHQQFLTRLSVALIVDGNAKQNTIEACVDELCGKLARVRALADEYEQQGRDVTARKIRAALGSEGAV